MKSFGSGPTATAPIISESSRSQTWGRFLLPAEWFSFILGVNLDFHPSLYYNWAARAFGRLVPVMRWWMFQSELYFVRCSGSERRDRAGARLTESGQFHQIIWFIGKINWVLQKLYSSRGARSCEDHIPQCIKFFRDLCWNFDWIFSQTLLDIIYLFNKFLIKYWKSISISWHKHFTFCWFLNQ